MSILSKLLYKLKHNLNKNTTKLFHLEIKQTYYEAHMAE